MWGHHWRPLAIDFACSCLGDSVQQVAMPQILTSFFLPFQMCNFQSPRQVPSMQPLGPKTSPFAESTYGSQSSACSRAVLCLPSSWVPSLLSWGHVSRQDSCLILSLWHPEGKMLIDWFTVGLMETPKGVRAYLGFLAAWKFDYFIMKHLNSKKVNFEIYFETIEFSSYLLNSSIPSELCRILVFVKIVYLFFYQVRSTTDFTRVGLFPILQASCLVF